MITLTCSDIEIQVIMEALSQLPLHRSFDVFVNVRQQVTQQRQPQAAQPGQPGQVIGGQPNGNDVSN